MSSLSKSQNPIDPKNGKFFVIAGFQKCASTWLHRCLELHPEIKMPKRHMTHFFDIHFHKGESWYLEQFESKPMAHCWGDATVSYARSRLALERIYCFSPKTKVILLVRNPIQRAWSHFWHEKRKGKTNFNFDEWKENYDVYSDWILPGIYKESIETCDSIFSPDQLHLIVHDDIVQSPDRVIKSVLNFLELSSEFTNDIVSTKQNQTINSIPKDWLGRPKRFNNVSYAEGPSDESIVALGKVFRQTVDFLSDRLDRDLTHWLKWN